MIDLAKAIREQSLAIAMSADAITAAIDRNTAAMTQQMEPEPPDEEENPTGGFTSLDQVEPGQTL